MIALHAALALVNALPALSARAMLNTTLTPMRVLTAVLVPMFVLQVLSIPSKQQAHKTTQKKKNGIPASAAMPFFIGATLPASCRKRVQHFSNTDCPDTEENSNFAPTIELF